MYSCVLRLKKLFLVNLVKVLVANLQQYRVIEITKTVPNIVLRNVQNRVQAI
jgi:hypothetical protein